jgi:uncharacterized protein (TIGR02391 family)
MAASNKIAPLNELVLRRVCDLIAATDGGLTGSEIRSLLADAGIDDPTPYDAGAGTYIAITKRDRLYTALAAAQRRSGAGNVVVGFLKKAMHPARYTGSPDLHADRLRDLNVVLSFAALRLRDDNVMVHAKAATTLADARRRAEKLKSILTDRGAHPRLLAACVSEIRDENYFHAVLEGAKSLAAEIRRRTGSTLDGVSLAQATLQITKNHPVPMLALNTLETDTQKSRQNGLDAGIRAIFSAARNPTAHEPKVLSTMTEQDAVDLLTQMSYLHRRIDECTDTGHLRTP